MQPSVIIVTGNGLTCEAESRYAWELAGATVTGVHLNDLLNNPKLLRDHSALTFAGGFSFGDHMGAGHVMALRLGLAVKEELAEFIASGKLILGIGNGFQVMIKLGLLPGLEDDYFTQKLTFMHNDCGYFQNFWVNLKFENDSPCVFTKGIAAMPLPVRHAEGKLFTPDSELLARIESLNLASVRYAHQVTGDPTNEFPYNPNGSMNAIAGLCDPTGRVFGLMPHPEAYLFPENHPNWDSQKLAKNLPADGAGLQIFKNGVEYLRQA